MHGESAAFADEADPRTKHDVESANGRHAPHSHLQLQTEFRSAARIRRTAALAEMRRRARRASGAPAVAIARRPRRRGGNGGGRRRSTLGRVVYWGAVLGLWMVLGIGRRPGLGLRSPAADPVARNPQAPAFDPDRLPRRPAVCHARRRRTAGRAEGAAALRAAGLHRHRGPPLLFAPRHRSARHRPRHARQCAAPRRGPGRLDHHPAARQESVSHAGAHAHPQAAGSRAGALDRASITSKNEILELYLNRVYFGAGAYGIESAVAALFQQAGKAALARRGRDPCRPRPLALAPGAKPQSQRRRAARPDRARRHGRVQKFITDDMAKAALVSSGAGHQAGRHRHGQLRRRLGHGRARRPHRPCRRRHRDHDLDRSRVCRSQPRRRWSTRLRKKAKSSASPRAPSS